MPMEPAAAEKVVDIHKLSAGGLLVSLGIVFGDIGTSPLYVMKAIISGQKIAEPLILGGLSAIFWTLTLQTTIKYVVLTLRADNNGEGGIFSLFALVRRRWPRMIFVAMVGGASLLADGIITPSISVSSAIEGVQLLRPDIHTVPIVLLIISLIFLFQQFGTGVVGRWFGPVMLLWFGMLAVVGVVQILHFPHVLLCVNPMYAIHLFAEHPTDFWLLGAIFLCTTGAEALYSDLGHVGRANIRVSWGFVKTALLLNYFGQGAFLLNHQGEMLNSNPFYDIMPEWFLFPGIALATLATIIASQALISGTYTLMSEAIRLELFPKVMVRHPSDVKGQLYIPMANNFLWIGCLAVVLFFQHSSRMEAAYGLAITVTMLMTTLLMTFYLYQRKWPVWGVGVFLLTYLVIEGSFFVANMTKFVHGGYVTVVIALGLFLLMYISLVAHRIRSHLRIYVPIRKYVGQLRQLSVDREVPKYATHLVYLTSTQRPEEIDHKVVYSILQKQPKRADVYWFVHIETTEDPYTMEYEALVLAEDDIVRVNFRLGFRVDQKIYLYLRTIAEDMVRKGELKVDTRYHSEDNYLAGDFMFVIAEEILSNNNELRFHDQLVMSAYVTLKSWTASPERWFGLDTSAVTFEQVPLIVQPISGLQLRRVQAGGGEA